MILCIIEAMPIIKNWIVIVLKMQHICYIRTNHWLCLILGYLVKYVVSSLWIDYCSFIFMMKSVELKEFPQNLHLPLCGRRRSLIAFNCIILLIRLPHFPQVTSI